MTPRLPWRRTFLLGLGFFGVSLVWPLYDSFVPLFLARFGLSASLIGFAMTIDNYVNMFVQPWVGQRSDRTRTRIGRRFPYVVIGAPLAAAGAMLIPFAAQRTLPLLLVAMFLFTISMALFRTPVVSLLGDVFQPEVRAKANGIINFMGVLAAVLAFVVGGMLFDRSEPLPFIAFAVAMLLMLGALMLFTREPAAIEGEGAPPAEGLKATLTTLFRNPDRRALGMLAALTAWSVGITALQAFWSLFATTELGVSEGTAPQLLSLYPLAGLIAAIPGGYLGEKIGRRQTILICLVIVAALLVAFLTIQPEMLRQVGAFQLMNPGTWFSSPGLGLVLLLLAGVGAAMTIITVNALPLLFDATPAGQIGSYTGLYYFFGSIASILGPPLGGLLADATGSYRTIFFFAPLWVAIGFVILLRTRTADGNVETLKR